MIGVLTKDEIYKQFDTQLKRECKTVLVLKSLKMNGKARTVWIPRTVAYMLKEWKKKQNDIKKKPLLHNKKCNKSLTISLQHRMFPSY